MWSIALETSTITGSLALFRGKELVEESSCGRAVRHGKAIGPVMKDFLDHHNLKAKDISFLSVSIGPGSFTGIRVGLATAHGFARAVGGAVVGVNSFEALARKVTRLKNIDNSPLVILQDARRQRLYGGVFRIEGSKVASQADCWVLPTEKALLQIPPGALLVGQGAKLLPSIEGFHTLEQTDLEFPEARDVGLLGWESFQRCDFPPSPKPLYLMVTEAEEKLKNQTKTHL